MSIEDVERYWSASPCNIRHSPVDIDEFPGLFSWEVSNRKYRVEPHIPAFADFPRWDGRSVLELGCGIGTDTLSFAAHGARVVTIDISEKSLGIARKRAVALGQSNRIVFVQGNIEEIDTALASLKECGTFAGERDRFKYGPRDRSPDRHTFDLVYSFGAIHHTPHPGRVLWQIQPYMRSNSILKIMLYHRYTPKVLSALRHWRPGMSVDEAVAKMSEAQSGCPITYTYSKNSAAELLHDFEILDMRIDHIFPWRVRDYINYRYVYNWWWRVVPPRLFRFLEQRWGWHLLITARLK